jgi:hypothetical protein
MKRYLMGMDAKYGPMEAVITEDKEIRIETGGVAITMTLDEFWIVQRWVGAIEHKLNEWNS